MILSLPLVQPETRCHSLPTPAPAFNPPDPDQGPRGLGNAPHNEAREIPLSGTARVSRVALAVSGPFRSGYVKASRIKLVDSMIR